MKIETVCGSSKSLTPREIDKATTPIPLFPHTNVKV